MSDPQKNIDWDALNNTILSWLKSRVGEDGFHWIKSKSEQLKKEAEDWEFFSSFSAVPRYMGKKPLKLSEEEQQQAETLRRGWKPELWSVDQLGRTLLVLSIGKRDKKEFLEWLEKTFISSDMGESVALYQSIPVLPYPDELQERAAEGIRSNITSVFNAVALYNPYPADYMDEDAWNQMVLKALFVGSPLYKIQGIDRRKNKKLAGMLVDYAHERWAAGRSVSPELWRPVGPFAENKIIEDLIKVLNHPDKVHRQAAVLALLASPSEKARELINEHHDLKIETEEGGVGWVDIGRRVEGG